MDQQKNVKKTINLSNNTISNNNKNISSRIEHVFMNNQENIWDNLQRIIKKSLIVVERELRKGNTDQEKVFDTITIFLNSFLKQVPVYLFFNNIPNLNIQDYAKMPLGAQLINNVYEKSGKIFDKNETLWWSCRYRTILLNNFFEELKNVWLEIQKKMVYYRINWYGHSALIIKFWGKIYIADFFWINEKSKQVINSVESLNKIHNTKTYSIFWIDKDSTDAIHYFEDSEKFAQYTEEVWDQNLIFQYKVNGKNVRIEMAKWYIALIIDGEIKKFRLPDFIDKELGDYSDLFQDTLKSISAKPEHKKEIEYYLGYIRKKINLQKLQKIYKK